jgi:hypothetical protein
MSFEKSPIAHSWLCIPGYVANEISNIVFLAMSFLALSCAYTREPIPGYDECENPYTRFLAMSFLAMYGHPFLGLISIMNL